MEYAGVLFAVDEQTYYLYVDEDRRMVLSPYPATVDGDDES